MVQFTVSGGTLNYSLYLDEKRKPYSTSEDLSNLALEHICCFGDAKNCGPKTATFTITEPPVMDVSLISKTDLCVLATIWSNRYNVVGGTAPYNYAWRQDQMVL
jgi:hypothetical protein